MRFLPGLGVIGPLLVKFSLNRLEQRSIQEMAVCSPGQRPPRELDLTDIEAIAQESGKRPTGERDASDCSSIG